MRLRPDIRKKRFKVTVSARQATEYVVQVRPQIESVPASVCSRADTSPLTSQLRDVGRIGEDEEAKGRCNLIDSRTIGCRCQRRWQCESPAGSHGDQSADRTQACCLTLTDSATGGG